MKKLDKNITLTACLLGAITIVLGAFGAHSLKALVSEDMITIFETGVRYQMYHVVVLLVIGLSTPISEKTKRWVFRFFLFGILLFSGSLYILSLGEILSINTKIIGPITPFGGLLYILGWLRLGYGMLKSM